MSKLLKYCFLLTKEGTLYSINKIRADILSMNCSKCRESGALSPSTVQSIAMEVSRKHETASFYRRPLPESCISFASSEGKQLFRQALQNGGLECYFGLAEQYRTQDEPTYCGLSTLTMVINALAIDPGRIWKGPWRWYSEELLDCCVPLEEIKANERGISLDEMVCLARCNACDVNVVLAQDTTLDDFRDVLRHISRQTSTFLVCAYSRKALGQTGDGHYSPIGGYNEEEDMCLIFDVARFKYPPHWVKVNLLWEAMMMVATDKKSSRGYLLISRSSLATSIFFHIYKRPNMKQTISWFLQQIEAMQKECKSDGSFCAQCDETQVVDWVKCFIHCLPSSGIVSMMGTYLEQCATVELDQRHRELISQVLSELENTKIFQVVEDCLKDSNCCEESNWVHLSLQEGLVKRTHMLSMLLLIIPHSRWQKFKVSTQRLAEALDPDDLPELLRNEVTVARRQLDVMCKSECQHQIYPGS